MLRFILGGAGTGKSHLMTEMIKKDIENGKRVYLIVPEQETVAKEREMLFILPPSAQLNFEVLNFTRLANSVFRMCGGLTYNYVSGAVKHLVMWNTLRSLSPLLSEYGRCGDDTELASLMLSQIEELKAYSVSPEDIESVMEKADKEGRTYRKLRDISLIYASYREAIRTFGASDASDDIGKLADTLADYRYFEGATVYIDSFTSFTGSEYKVIKEIMCQADELSVALCLSDVGARAGLQFELTGDTMRRIKSIAESKGVESDTVYLKENRRAQSESLAYLSENLWSFGLETRKPLSDNSVKLIKCTNIYEEAEAAASEISKLVMGGMRYRDIAVIARDEARFDGVIDNALANSSIPYFVSRKEDVTAMPAAKLLLSALRIKNRGWNTEDVISYLKTGLTGIDTHSADLFEQYIWKWSITGGAFLGDDWIMNPDSYSGELSDRQRLVLDEVNKARRELVQPLQTLFERIDKAKNGKDTGVAIYSYLEEFSIADKIKALAIEQRERGEKAEAARSARLYNTILDILGIIAEFDSGDDRLDSAGLETALRILLSETDLGTIPTSCDEVVIGSASLFRADKPKCVIMIGMNDGVFPAEISERGMLTDEDKLFLSMNGITLSGMGDIKASEELFYAYRAVSAPSEMLIMTYSACELQGGKELVPSIAFERARKLLSAPVINYASLPLSERLYGESTAFEYALLAEGSEGEALRRLFSESENYSERLSAASVPLFNKDRRVSNELSEELFGRNKSFSPTALERFVGCHFSYWCKYQLKIRPEERNEFRLVDSGTLVHSLLGCFVRAVTDENGFNATLAEEQVEELIEKLIELYAEENFPKRDAEKERVKHILKKLRHLSTLVAKNMTEELKNSKFVPSFFELKINGREEGSVRPLEIEVAPSVKASVIGTVDRVDLLRDGDDVYVKVVDYKTGSKTFSLDDIKRGVNLQMLLYLFSICGDERNKALLGCSENGELKGAGVVYLSSKVEKASARQGDDVESAISGVSEKLMRSGIVLSDDKIIEALNKDKDFKYIISGASKNEGDSFKTSEEFEEIKESIKETLANLFGEIRCGNASADPVEKNGMLPCHYCEMKAICRMGHLKKAKNEEGDEV